MQISDNLMCLFSAQVKEENGKYVIEVPAREVSQGQIQPGQVNRAAVLPSTAEPPEEEEQSQDSESNQSEDQSGSGAPVEVGEQRTVEIEDIGEQGDGIARVDGGYVVIVPDTELSERVRIEIQNVSDLVAFGEVVERLDYYE